MKKRIWEMEKKVGGMKADLEWKVRMVKNEKWKERIRYILDMEWGIKEI